MPRSPPAVRPAPRSTQAMRRTLVCLALALPAVPVSDARPAAQVEKDSLVWHDARDLRVEGKGWEETAAFYDRLPAKAEKMVRPPVWNLSRHSAGLCVSFVTDATALHARW